MLHKHEDADTRVESLRQLVAGTAHDLNNLLVLVNGCAELALMDEALSPRARQLVKETLDAGNLRGVRKRIWERFGGTFYAEQAEDALNALHERPLTTHATNQLSIALRNKYADQDILDLLDRLHREDRLVIGSSESDELRIVCSIGVTDT